MFDITFPPETRSGVLAAYDKAKIILEYGTGGSTIYAASAPEKTVIGVESDRAWLDRLTQHASDEKLPGHLVPFYVDIGPTREWGHPVDGTHSAKFLNYPLAPWRKLIEEGTDPDLVLIDGRFRVGCFLATLASIRKPTKIIFDDYADRPKYHVVEKWLSVHEYIGRAAIFIADPDTISTRLFVDNFKFLSITD